MHLVLMLTDWSYVIPYMFKHLNVCFACFVMYLHNSSPEKLLYKHSTIGLIPERIWSVQFSLRYWNTHEHELYIMTVILL